MSAGLYLLDANVLINAKNFYYAFDQVPEFWEWLVDQGVRGKVKSRWEFSEKLLEAMMSCLSGPVGPT